MQTLPPVLKCVCRNCLLSASAEYEAIHSAWHKAIKTLPDFTVVHKQDWYIKESYAPDLAEDNQSFLAKSYQRHFNEQTVPKSLLLPVP